MIIKKHEEVPKTNIEMEGVKDTSIRWLIGPESEAPNFYLRLFELAPGGHTPFHTHSWEHEVYVVEGEGEIKTENGPVPFKTGSFALVKPDEKHQFRNTGNAPFKFLCIIPKDGK